MSFQQELEADVVASLTIRPAILLTEDTVARAAVALMRRESLGCAVVADHGRLPRAFFTEQSVASMLLADACLDSSAVATYVERSIVCVRKGDPISRVWRAVQDGSARYVCVTDDAGRAIGITGQRALAEYLADCFSKQVVVQRLGETPWLQQREGA